MMIPITTTTKVIIASSFSAVKDISDVSIYAKRILNNAMFFELRMMCWFFTNNYYVLLCFIAIQNFFIMTETNISSLLLIF